MISRISWFILLGIMIFVSMIKLVKKGMDGLFFTILPSITHQNAWLTVYDGYTNPSQQNTSRQQTKKTAKMTHHY